MAESGDYDLEETPKDNPDGSRDGHDAEWDVSGAYESNNSGLTADIGINDALHSFQGRSDFLLEKYVHKFNARASRIDELRFDIEQLSDDLIEKQKLQNCIKAEAFGYVCQLQQSAAMLAPVDSDKDVETYTTRDDNDVTSNYQKQNERQLV